MTIFTILYGNYYPLHGEFKLMCIGKLPRRTWVNFTQQYKKNCQSCQQNAFYYAVWQLLLYFYREFSSRILSVYCSIVARDSLETLAYHSLPKYWMQKNTKILKQNVWQLAPVYPIKILRPKDFLPRRYPMMRWLTRLPGFLETPILFMARLTTSEKKRKPQRRVGDKNVRCSRDVQPPGVEFNDVEFKLISCFTLILRRNKKIIFIINTND